jgi:hypothetical protein
LKGLGVDCDIVDVGGNSGYSFLINVAQGKISPSGPTAHNHETWKQIYNGTESLGWTLGHYKYPQVYPARKGSPTPEEIEVARELFDRIKQEIDEKDRPVVLSGLVAPEFGIVKGYDGDFYITSTFRSYPLLEINRRTESPILFYDLDAPGGIHAFFFQDRVKVDSKSADEEALQRAIRFARGKISVLDAYVGGPGALDTWANDLESLAEEEVDYMSNSYLGACVAEGRWMSGEFLKRFAKRSVGQRSKRLQQASQSYGKGMSLMKEFVRIFPFKYHGKMKLEDRKKGAETLRKVKTCEEEAIMQMMEAL